MLFINSKQLLLQVTQCRLLITFLGYEVKYSRNQSKVTAMKQQQITMLANACQ